MTNHKKKATKRKKKTNKSTIENNPKVKRPFALIDIKEHLSKQMSKQNREERFKEKIPACERKNALPSIHQHAFGSSFSA
jgi:hypothetical protein